MIWADLFEALHCDTQHDPVEEFPKEILTIYRDNIMVLRFLHFVMG